MNTLRDMIMETIEDMDAKNSAASMPLVQVYFYTKDHNLSDRVITAVLEQLSLISELDDEEQAEYVASNINKIVRTVAA